LALGTLNFADCIGLPALVSLDRRAAPGTRASYRTHARKHV
jgi:hypothetical protein